MQSWFSLEIDGRVYRVEGEEATRKTLAWFIDQRGIGGDGAYSDLKPWSGGAAVLMVDGDAENRATYRAIDSSVLLLAQAAKRKFLTAEGMMRATQEEGSHPLIDELAQTPLIDCGRTGQNNALIALFEGYYRRDLKKTGQVMSQFDGCISRSADYVTLRDLANRVFAISQSKWDDAERRAKVSGQEDEVAAKRIDIFGDPFSAVMEERSSAAHPISFVDPRKRRFYRPDTLVELLRLLTQYPESDIIAGGTDMGLQSARGEVEWQSLISVEGITELRTILEETDHWEIGSAAPISLIVEKLGESVPSIAKISSRFGSRLIRNRATLGGYLASAHPAGELAPLLMALDAKVRIINSDGERDVPVSGFFDTPSAQTVLRPGEVIKSIVLPRFTQSVMKSRGCAVRFCDVYKAASLRAMNRAIVTGGFAVELDEAGVVRKAWLAYSGVGGKPVRARRVEADLVGKPWSEKSIVSVLPVLNQELKLADDIRASAVYRKQLVITLFQKFFYQHPRPDEPPVNLGAQSEFLRGDLTFLEALKTVES